MKMAHIENRKIKSIEDTIGFGSTAPYCLECGKPYSIRILSRCGMFEIYVNDSYLQTFNNAHNDGDVSTPFKFFGAASVRKNCTLSDIKIYSMSI